MKAAFTTLKIDDWNNKQLSSSQKAIKHIREKVFVCEYHIPPDIEFDHKDRRCKHVLVQDKSETVATGRISDKGKISRVAVLKNYRNTEVPKQVLSSLLTIAKDNGLTRVSIDSDLQQVNEFQQQGFKVMSPVFMKSGIAKQTLVCEINRFICCVPIIH